MGKSLIIIGSKPTDIYGWGNNPEEAAKYKQLRAQMSQYIKDNEITDVYSTLDLGAEQIGAEAAINAGSQFHALIPYNNQDAKWADGTKENYAKILKYAADKTQIDGDYAGVETSKRRLEYLRNLVETEQAEVLMVYNGNEGDKSMYALNTLKKALKSSGLEPPKFLDPRDLSISEKQPYPERPRIVSEERIAAIEAQNNDPNRMGKYTRADRQYMSDLWKAYLDKLELRPEHELDLLNRGFTKEQIAEFGYKSLPRSKDEADKLVESMLADGWDLSRAPGFGIAGDGGAFSTQTMKDGYFCPARDTELDRLYGMQIRNCDKEEAKKYGKYTWFSAGKNNIGLSSSQPAAYYEGNMTMNVGGQERPVILITEGVLKCNLAYLGMGRQVGIVGMAGVYGQKGLYVYDEKGEAEKLDPADARHLFKDAVVVECFDADFVKNKNVRNASYRIRNELVDVYGAYATCRMTWSDAGKGIDDYVVDCNRDGKDIDFHLSNVIMAGSPTEVVTNEYGKPETRHMEISDIEKSPLKGLGIHISMQDVYDAGYKIQPKIEVPKADTPQTAQQEVQKPAEPVETEAQHKARKYLKHLNERCGTREIAIKKAFPGSVIDANTRYAHDAGKFIVTMPSFSTLDVDLKRRAAEIKMAVEEDLGVDESKAKGEILVSEPVTLSEDNKAVVVMFNNFEGDRKAVNHIVKGVIDDTFHKFDFDMSHTYTVSVRQDGKGELNIAQASTGCPSVEMPIPTAPNAPQSLNESLCREPSETPQQSDEFSNV